MVFEGVLVSDLGEDRAVVGVLDGSNDVVPPVPQLINVSEDSVGG